MTGSVLNPNAVKLWNSKLKANDRVLILGGSGWFGQTAFVMTALPSEQVLLVSKSSRQLLVCGRAVETKAFSWKKIEDFEPTIVLDFWFPPRANRGDGAGYLEEARELSDRSVLLASLPTVRKVISVSSGAVHDRRVTSDSILNSDVYSQAKREAEDNLRGIAKNKNLAVTLVRAFSVSGSLVTRPQSFAFSDLAMQSIRGRVRITTRRMVWRKFVAVEDLLAVALPRDSAPWTTVESGGDLIEIRQLARLIADCAGTHPVVSQEAIDGDLPADKYFSRSSRWDLLCKEEGFQPMDLREQAHRVLQYFMR